MDKPKSLDSLFSEKIFRIPDYQRGYAWQPDQLTKFWEDLINLADSRSHYTGVLTLKKINDIEISENSKEFWLVDDYSYKIYHIVDGQQRLTTFIIFLQAFIEFIKTLPENLGKSENEIYITDSLNITALQERYLFKVKPTGDMFRSYLFGYETDNPSYEYLRFRIFGEDGAGSIDETFYTLNLSNAKIYFLGQLLALHKDEGIKGLQEIFKKLTKRFLFNEYVIEDEFDVFVAFETMNNRGKNLSNLELLKNRLIYLTTLYPDDELDSASRKNLRETINDAWKEIYHQLGRNKSHPLKDDDFLRAHWMMYFRYSRDTGQDYIKYLLEEKFTPKKILKKTEQQVRLEIPVEVQSEQDMDDSDDNDELEEQVIIKPVAQLAPTEIRDYANSLKESVVHWFNSFFPSLALGMSEQESQWIDRLNRIGIGYFRPLVMAILKNTPNKDDRIAIFQKIERFIFINFRMNSAMVNSGSSEFYNAVRAIDRKEIDIKDIENKLNARLSYTFHADKTFRSDDFYNGMFRKFKARSGYYGWAGLRYLLFEYETSLAQESRQKKVEWSDLFKKENDKITIEHIYPQTESVDWVVPFETIAKEQRWVYGATLGNLLLLSSSINSSLQNIGFTEKKKVKIDASGNKIRNGYSDGSHSEIEVSRLGSWGPDEITERGLKLIKFMERRWDFHIRDDKEREKLLFLDIKI